MERPPALTKATPNKKHHLLLFFNGVPFLIVSVVAFVVLSIFFFAEYRLLTYLYPKQAI